MCFQLTTRRVSWRRWNRWWCWTAPWGSGTRSLAPPWVSGTHFLKNPRTGRSFPGQSSLGCSPLPCSCASRQTTCFVAVCWSSHPTSAPRESSCHTVTSLLLLTVPQFMHQIRMPNYNEHLRHLLNVFFPKATVPRRGIWTDLLYVFTMIRRMVRMIIIPMTIPAIMAPEPGRENFESVTQRSVWISQISWHF